MKILHYIDLISTFGLFRGISVIQSKCPGHITLIFSIHDGSLLPRAQGSRGVGICLEDGVRVELDHTGKISPDSKAKTSHGQSLDTPAVFSKNGELIVSIYSMNGEKFSGSDAMYHDLVSELREMYLLNKYDSFKLNIFLELPVSQGFGMSASGLLSASLAFFEFSNKGRLDQYVRLAHRLERKYHGGLGDVLGIYLGGVEMRVIAGSPGAGGIGVSFGTQTDVLLVWEDSSKRHTSTYIDDPKWKQSISKAGDKCVDELSIGSWDEDKWPNILENSMKFSTDSGMLEEKARAKFLAKVNSSIEASGFAKSVQACLCMLGISAVILPKSLDQKLTTDQLENIGKELQKQGLECKVSRIES